MQLYAPPSHLAISHPCRSLRPLGKCCCPPGIVTDFARTCLCPQARKTPDPTRLSSTQTKTIRRFDCPQLVRCYVFYLYPTPLLQMFGRCESHLLFVWCQCMHGHTNLHLVSYVELSESVGKWTLTQLCVFRVLILEGIDIRLSSGLSHSILVQNNALSDFALPPRDSIFQAAFDCIWEWSLPVCLEDASRKESMAMVGLGKQLIQNQPLKMSFIKWEGLATLGAITSLWVVRMSHRENMSYLRPLDETLMGKRSLPLEAREELY